MRRIRRGVPLLALALAAGAAWAHSAGLSRGIWRFSGSRVEATITFARGEVSDLAPHLDGNLDGVVSENEVAAAWPALETGLVNATRVSAGAAACAGRLRDAKLVEGDGLEIDAEWTCPDAGAANADVEVNWVDQLSRGHRHLLTLLGSTGGGASFAYRESKRFAVPASRAPRIAAVPSMLAGMRSSLAILATLAALLAAGGAVRSLAGIALAWTLGVGAASLSRPLGIAPDVRFLAPAAALALLYVGADSLLVNDARGRTPIALLLGLVSGLLVSRGAPDAWFSAGAIAASLFAGVLLSAATARLSRERWWPVVISVGAFAAMTGGAWWLVRSLA